MNSPKRYAHLEKVPESWWAYFGGLFTGEGYIDLRDTLSASLNLEICDHAVCQGIKRAVGGTLRKLPVHGTQLQQPYRWSVYEPILIFQILRHIRPYIIGKKAKQSEALLRFMLLKLNYQERMQREGRRRYTTEEKLKLLELARQVREWSGGGNKAWKKRWTQRARVLKREVRLAKV